MVLALGAQQRINAPAKRFGAAHKLGTIGPAQATPRRKQRQRLQHIGFARTIGPVKRNRPPIQFQMGGLVAAKMR